ncbi:MAG: family efflux transporter [Actinomycetia bacterium]|nr:family efflux transporter [Actinomycetes bacterium]
MGRLRAFSHPDDRAILRLAVPAFATLIAEPLYVLADTAIVGRLGTRPLAGLAVAAAVLTTVFWLVNSVTVASAGLVARRYGRSDERGAAEVAVSLAWLCVALGAILLVVFVAVPGPVVRAFGASAGAAPDAALYLRISAVGLPFLLCTAPALNYLRGLQDTRTPLLITLAANIVNIVLEVVLVYGFDAGLAGSAWGTVIAQVLAFGAYAWVTVPRVRSTRAARRPRSRDVREIGRLGGYMLVRTLALTAALTGSTAIAARMSDVEVAAHQVVLQLWLLSALALDAIAIAGIALIGKRIGENDRERAESAARRMIRYGVWMGIIIGVVMVATRQWLPGIFSDDRAVQHAAQGALLVSACMQPLSGYAFTLDGILLGAGDTRAMAGLMLLSLVLVFVPAAAIILATGAGLTWLWVAIAVWVASRAVGLAWRYHGARWLVMEVPTDAGPTGAAVPTD